MAFGAAVKGVGGKKGRSGRKTKAEEFGLAALLDKAWSKSDRIEVIQTLHSQAKDGNTSAASLLLAYAYGKPTEKHEHGGEGGGPLEILVSYVSKPPKD